MRFYLVAAPGYVPGIVLEWQMSAVWYGMVW